MKLVQAVFSSSIGRKYLVAITGLLLCGFLVTHLAGNLLLFKGQSVFDSYAEYIEHHPLLLIAEIGLVVLFLGHILTALIVTAQDYAARPIRYESRANHGGSTVGSSTMIFTGLFILVFLIIHLVTFRFGDHEAFNDSMFAVVTSWFKKPVYALFYVAAMWALGVHISHGFQSAFQTLGLRFPQYTTAIKGLGYLFALVITFGFGLMPIWGLLR